MHRARLLSIAALLIALLAIAPAAARAGFAPAVDPIVEAEQLTTDIATDASGDSLLVWSQKQTLASNYEGKARLLAANGKAGPIFDLAPGELIYRPHLAITPAGRAFVAWRSRPAEAGAYGVKGRWVEADGTLGPLLTLATGEAGNMDAGETRVAIDPAGVATVVWGNQSDFNSLELRRVGPDSSLGPLATDISSGSTTNPQIAALPNGSTLAVWRGTGTEAAVVTATLEVSAPTQISETPGAGDNQLAVDGVGNVLVVWRQSGGVDEYSVRGRRLTATGAATGPELVIDPLAKGFVGSRPEIAANTLGNFIVTWSRQDGNGDDQVFARGVDATGTFAGPAQPVSAAGVNSEIPLPAILDSGAAPLAWESDEASGNSTYGAVLDRQAQLLSGPGLLHGDDFGPDAVGTAPAGLAAFLVEYAVSGSAQGAVVARYLLPPTCVDSTATVVQGRPVSVPLSCSGLGVDAATLTAGPQHGSVSFDPAILSFSYTPRPGFAGSDSFAYAGANAGGAAAPVRVSIAVGKDTVKPRIKTLKLVKKLRKRDPRRYSFKFRLAFSEPATAKLTIKQFVRVRGKGKLRKLGTVRTKNAGLKATVPVKGKLASRLGAGGRFRVVAVASDAAGNKSTAKKRPFRVG